MASPNPVTVQQYLNFQQQSTKSVGKKKKGVTKKIIKKRVVSVNTFTAIHH
jgi:hypothetical protein